MKRALILLLLVAGCATARRKAPQATDPNPRLAGYSASLGKSVCLYATAVSTSGGMPQGLVAVCLLGAHKPNALNTFTP